MDDNQIELITKIVSAYVANNSVPVGDLPRLIADVGTALTKLGQPTPEPQPERAPAVNPKKSVFPDYLISLEDGKHYRTLKRHLAKLGLTPNDYRQKWDLPRDYPMVAAAYAAKRSELAKALGLGRKREAPAAPPAPEPEAAPEEAPKKRSRRKADAEA